MDRLKIKWSQRLPLEKLRRLYVSEARGMLNVELLEDVATTLYLRCKDIIAVDRSRHGEVRCPFCYEATMKETYVQVNRDDYGRILDTLQCMECTNAFSYAEYKRCYKREQLNMGGAGEAFKRYISQYEQPATPQKRILQIDRLIHEFHYSSKSDPNQPTRSVGPNLLGANLTVAMRFLDELSGITGDNQDMKNTVENWQEEKSKFDEFWWE